MLTVSLNRFRTVDFAAATTRF